MKNIILKYSNENIYLVGDLHGNFDEFNFLIHGRYKINNSLFIQVGDFGVGFYKEGYYLDKLGILNKKLSKNNNTLLVIRGNHDNPIYFNSDIIKFTNLKLLSDYSIIETIKGNILCIGGEASIDFKLRIEGENFWKDELPIFCEEKLFNIPNIDYVVTHGMPSHTYPIIKYCSDDIDVVNYSKKGRIVFDLIYQNLLNNNHLIKKWFSGHYHEHHIENVLGVDYQILDINEIKELL